MKTPLVGIFLILCGCSAIQSKKEVVYVETIRCDNPTTENKTEEREKLKRFVRAIIIALRPSIEDPALFADKIVALSEEERVDPIFVTAIIASESRFAEKAKSKVGARGMMQLMPKTATYIANRHNFDYQPIQITHPETNIKLGIRYIKELEERYNGNRFLALSAYNWGPGKVDRKKNATERFPKSVRKYSLTIIDNTNNWNRHLAGFGEM